MTKEWNTGDYLLPGDLNRIEQSLEDNAFGVELVAHDLGGLRINFIDLAIETEMLKQAQLTGVNANIIIETFQTIEDIDLLRGGYDSENKRLEV